MKRFPANSDKECKFFQLDVDELQRVLYDVEINEFTPLIQAAERLILALERAGYVEVHRD